MHYEPQRFHAPDGTELVVITRADYDRLVAGPSAAEDADDLVAARAVMAASDGFTVPIAVVHAQLAGESTIAAWRKLRGLSQAQLAAAAGLSQAAIARLEGAPDGSGRAGTRRTLAQALDIPLWALEQGG